MFIIRMDGFSSVAALQIVILAFSSLQDSGVWHQVTPQQHVPEEPIVSLTTTQKNYLLCAEPLLEGSKYKHENVHHSLDLEMDPNKTGPS